ncbi:hypothetical protein DFH08DRAFT_858037 [Mycena albidolilacea]|uniref:DUF6534 domain-containing protein n=1 Tax=Mycena albidolilacea TaxID=1033008 RepID=A0AAD7EUL5_9AGAR|nr:hypothetical protein DFH08DRAFT_858037 [Mycena albidolilacea]
MGEIDETLGALVVAYVLAWGLFGVMSMQSFNYFQRFSKDTLWLKSLVGGLWLLDTLQLVLIGHVLYYWVITNYDNPKVLAVSVWSFNIGILVTNTIVLIVELFLARRVYILSNKNRLLTGLIVFLSFTYFGFEMAVQVRTFQLKRIALFFEFQWIASVGLACASAADLIIAASLSYYLLKSRTGIKTTDSVVNKLILYAMNTGLLTGICVLIDMICFLTMPKNLIHIAFNLVVGKLYTNSLLATLNFRDTIRKGAKEVHTFSLNAMPTDTTANFKFRAAPGTETTPSMDRTLNISTDNGGYESTRSIQEMKFANAV